MSDWVPVKILPNVDPRDPIECANFALVGPDDPRVEEVRQESENFDNFLNRFKDAFEASISPGIIIVNKNGSDKAFDIETVSSFRDCISISTIIESHKMRLLRNHGFRISFSDHFWMYPWMLDRENSNLIAATPAMLAVHDVNQFQGQSSPEISQQWLRYSHIDKPLLQELLSRWYQRYWSRRPSQDDIALFRSLNMANAAAKMPAGSDMVRYDVGRSIALWVSAFEILAHPRCHRSGLNEVYSLLKEVDWLYEDCGKRLYKIYRNSPRQAQRDIIACKIYGEIYQSRNKFLHGDPIRKNDLLLKRTKYPLWGLAAPLYRMALTAFLPLRWTQEPPDPENTEHFPQYIAQRMNFSQAQERAEKALLKTRQAG